MPERTKGHGADAVRVRPPSSPSEPRDYPWPVPESLGEAVSFPRGTVLHRQGATVRTLYLVDDGLVKVVCATRDGRECGVGLRTHGWLLGTSSAARSCPHFATAETVTECSLRSISAEAFLALKGTRLDVANWIIDMLARESTAHLEGLTLLGAATPRERLERLLALLLDIGPVMRCAGATKLDPPLTHREMAAIVGVGPEWITRLLRELEIEGVLKRKGGWLVFPSTGRLISSRDPLART